MVGLDGIKTKQLLIQGMKQFIRTYPGILLILFSFLLALAALWWYFEKEINALS